MSSTKRGSRPKKPPKAGTHDEGYAFGYRDATHGLCYFALWLQPTVFGEGYIAGWYARRKENDSDG
jgi:hypothetical protein